MSPSRRRYPGLLLLGVAVVLAVSAVTAWARPGGGESFSGGGGHGGGGDGEGLLVILELLFHLLRLLFHLDFKLALIVLAVIAGVIVIAAYTKHKNRDWDSGPAVPVQRATSLLSLRATDPDFSPIVFEDFVAKLFTQAHRARARQADLDGLAPYVSGTARAHLAAMTPQGAPVQGVVIGALRAVRLEAGDSQPGARTVISVEFEANVMAGGAGQAQTYFVVETWRLSRVATATSKPPARDRVTRCPNCGAPWQASQTGTQVCSYCDTAVDNGRFDWTVDSITVRQSQARPPSLLGQVAERGTDLSTYMQPGFEGHWQALRGEDPALDDAVLYARVTRVFDELNRAWGAQALGPIRGLLSDGQFDSLQYWVDAYRAQGLRNVVDDARLTHAVLCKLVRDKWYDALTIRIWGAGQDYTVRVADDTVVAGHRKKTRAYSEYWTFVRAASRRGPAKADMTCGNCSAPLDVDAGGACTHCHSHVTGGEFDWVLSKIEQDDSYRG